MKSQLRNSGQGTVEVYKYIQYSERVSHTAKFWLKSLDVMNLVYLGEDYGYFTFEIDL